MNFFLLLGARKCSHARSAENFLYIGAKIKRKCSVATAYAMYRHCAKCTGTARCYINTRALAECTGTCARARKMYRHFKKNRKIHPPPPPPIDFRKSPNGGTLKWGFAEIPIRILKLFCVSDSAGPPRHEGDHLSAKACSPALLSPLLSRSIPKRARLFFALSAGGLR